MSNSISDTFQALIVDVANDGAYIRRIGTRHVDELPPGEVLVRVVYSSINYKDALSATGHPGVTRHYPHTPGIDAAGTIEATECGTWRVGDEVIVTGFDLGMNTPGGLGERIRIPADWVIRRPEALSLKMCMQLGTAGFTAALAVHRMQQAGLSDAGDVVVTGATGGVGQCAVALLGQIGYRVSAVTGKADQESQLTDLGAFEVIARDDFTALGSPPMAKARWVGGIDTLGGPALNAMLKSAVRGGVVASCGLAASPNLETNVYPFILRGVSLLGIDSAETPITLKSYLWNRLAADWKIDRLEQITHEVNLEGVEAVIRSILEGTHQGRTVVRVS